MRVPTLLRRDVTPETLDAIAACVDRAESETSGEIVVHLVHWLLPLERVRDRAIRTFHQLGVHRTQRRNGVLLFVAMKKRRFEIVADAGVDACVDAETWVDIAKQIEGRIGRDGFQQGLCAGIEAIGAVLSRHFPATPDDVDELPDRPTRPLESEDG
jgi:uncharacterized membrane protein